MINNNKTIIQFPVQQKSDSQKTLSWGKQCIDSADMLTVINNEKVRTSHYNKRINYNLYDDILEEADVHKICNPFGITDYSSPAKMQNYPLTNTKIQRLLGEELKRKFEWKITVGNADAISLKEQHKKQQVLDLLANSLYQQDQDDNKIKAIIDEIQRINTTYQEDREKLSTQLLQYFWKTLNLKTMFNDGFKDALLAAEEIYCTDIVGEDPILRKVNPLYFYTIRSGNSPFIEDADIIEEETYMSPGQIVDTYYDYLKPNDIERLEKGLFSSVQSDGSILNYNMERIRLLADRLAPSMGSFMSNADRQGKGIGSTFDEYGNVRVIHIRWKSRRKVYERTYIDSFGDEQKDIVDEFYKPDRNAGEKLKEMWINEWWEGTRIGKDIYVRIRPRPVQFRTMGNISKCSSGYIGTVYNTNDGKGKSLMDRMKPYQYLYNVFMYRLELAFAKFKGPIYELDLSKIPDEWSMDQWMYYAETLGWAPVDPFNEGKKGAATGKLAGSYNTTGKVMDADMGNYIQHTINMLNFIKSQVDLISGISPQREGDVSTSENVGNVERAITQSSYITETYFSVHEDTKLRAMRALLETAKVAWRGKTKKLQYILDNMSMVMMTVDGDYLNDADYDVHLTTSSQSVELENLLKELAHAGLQNDKVTFSQIIDIFTTESLSTMARKIKAVEEENARQQAEQFERQQKAEEEKNQIAREQIQQANEFKAQELQLKKYEIDTKAMVAIRTAEINAYMKQQELDLDGDGIPDPVEIAGLALEQQALHSDNFNQELDRISKIDEDNRKASIQREKFKFDREKEELKLKQIQEQNKNQERMQDKDIKLKEKELAMKLQMEKIKAKSKNKPKK